jgi:hypothetical protein
VRARGNGTAMGRSQQTQDQNQSSAPPAIRFALLVWLLAVLFLVVMCLPDQISHVGYAVRHVPFLSFLLPVRETLLHFFTARYVF